jgi:hypothetical protein
MKLPMGRIVTLILMIFSLYLLTACATKPQIYSMPPGEIEALRSNIFRVGVVMLDSNVQTIVKLPAKGSGQGFVRGAAMGATLPVIIGILAPVPGSALVGILLAPIGAVVGSVYGSATAMSTDEVEAAERLLDQAGQEVRQLGLSGEFLDEVIRMGNQRTDMFFLKISNVSSIHPVMEEIEEDIKSEFDTILEIRIDKAGLNAIYSIDPPIEVFVKTSVRLIRTRDGQELLKDIIVCRSDEEKRINDWIKDGGESLTEEFKGCVPEVAEKIIDDFFLVYPICRDRNRLFNDTAQ